MKMMKQYRQAAACVGAVFMLGMASTAYAEELASLSSSLCEKVKACALQEMEAEGLDAGMRARIQPMLDNMCVGMADYADAVSSDEGLRKPAVACLKSLNKLTCEHIKSGEGVDTEACEEFRKRAQALESDR